MEHFFPIPHLNVIRAYKLRLKVDAILRHVWSKNSLVHQTIYRYWRERWSLIIWTINNTTTLLTYFILSLSSSVGWFETPVSYIWWCLAVKIIIHKGLIGWLLKEQRDQINSKKILYNENIHLQGLIGKKYDERDGVPVDRVTWDTSMDKCRLK